MTDPLLRLTPDEYFDHAGQQNPSRLPHVTPHCVYGLYSQGHRRLRSLPDEKSALAEARRLTELMVSGESRAAQVRGPEVASYGRAIELLRPTGVALKIAAGHLAETHKIMG